MTLITIPQARQRFKSLPENIQEAMFSFQTAEIVAKIAEQYHLPTEKNKFVAEAAGLVYLGFIHPEELPKEISERGGVDSQIARTIADSLNVRLFQPIRSDLDQVYAPALHDHEQDPIRILTEIKAPPPVNATQPKSAQPNLKKPGESFVELNTLKVQPPGGMPTTFTPYPSAPKQSSSVSAWPSPKPPFTPSGTAPSAQKPAQPAGATPVSPTPPVTPQTPHASPVMLHKETEVSPLPKMPGVRGLEDQLKTLKTESKTPQRAAHIEFKNMPATGPTAPRPVPPPPKPSTPWPSPQKEINIPAPQGPKPFSIGSFEIKNTPVSSPAPKSPTIPPPPPMSPKVTPPAAMTKPPEPTKVVNYSESGPSAPKLPAQSAPTPTPTFVKTPSPAQPPSNLPGANMLPKNLGMPDTFGERRAMSSMNEIRPPTPPPGNGMPNQTPISKPGSVIDLNGLKKVDK